MTAMDEGYEEGNKNISNMTQNTSINKTAQAKNEYQIQALTHQLKNQISSQIQINQPPKLTKTPLHFHPNS
jgi:hypothetical protein